MQEIFLSFNEYFFLSLTVLFSFINSTFFFHLDFQQQPKTIVLQRFWAVTNSPLKIYKIYVKREKNLFTGISLWISHHLYTNNCPHCFAMEESRPPD